MKGAIHSTESFGSVDGPGIRFIIFLRGCHMRCRYCHNPDTWALREENMTEADELLDKAERYRSYWGKEGGITVSGGEPLLQIDFLIDLFTKAKARGIHTTLDTCGQPFTRNEPFFSKFQRLLTVTDLVMLDLKHIDSAAHRDLTRHGNESILDCARYLSEQGQPMWIRHVLVPSINDDDAFLTRLGEFIGMLRTVEKVEVLPYHALGVHKWETLGIPYTLKEELPPTPARLENAERLLKSHWRKP